MQKTTPENNTTLVDHVRMAQLKRRIVSWLSRLTGNTTASVTNTTGSPAVQVQPNANGGWDFLFSGIKGEPGAPGGDGSDGKTYTPEVGSVTTVPPGVPASVTASVSGDKVIFNFIIPRGADGQDGTSARILPSAADCTEFGDSYIDENGHIQIWNGTAFYDGGVIRGPKGDDGATTYLYIRYAPTNTPTSGQIHTSPQTGDIYIGFATVTTSGTPTVPALFVWSRYVGTNGTNGADGTILHSTNSTSVFNSKQQQNVVPAQGDNWKVGDYMLNTAYGYVYKCFYIISEGAPSYWSYECCIKGEDGQPGSDGVTPAITVNASVNNTTGTPSVRVSRSGSDAAPVFNLAFSGLKGDDGQPGTDGSVVSMAYRFANSGGTLSSGAVTANLAVQLADARITINPKAEYADVHLTYYCTTSTINWREMMHALGAYELGSSCPVAITGRSIAGEKESYAILKNNWYGVINIRHDAHWESVSSEEKRPLVIDLHGTMDVNSNFDDLFGNNHNFDFELE